MLTPFCHFLDGHLKAAKPEREKASYLEPMVLSFDIAGHVKDAPLTWQF